MDIKLKKSSSKLIGLILAFLICVTCFAGALTMGITELFKVVRAGTDPIQVLSAKSYEESGLLQEDFLSDYNQIRWILIENPEEHAEWRNKIQAMIDDGLTFYVTNGETVYTSFTDKKTIKTASELISEGKEKGAYRIYTKSNLTGYPEIKTVDPYPGDVWFGNDLFQNEQEMMAADPTAENTGDNRIVYMAYSHEYLEKQKIEFDNMKGELIHALIFTGIATLLCIAAFIALCILCGKRDEAGNIALLGMNRWFTEIFLLAMGSSLFFGVFITLSLIDTLGSLQSYGYNNGNYYDHYYVSEFNTMELFLIGFGIWCTAALSLAFLLPLIRKIKARRFFKDFFVAKMIRWIWSGLKDIYYGSSIMKKVIITVFLLCLCSATVVFFPVVLVVSLVFASKWVKQYEEITAGIREVKNGNPSYKIPIIGNEQGELGQLAADINAISSGFDVAVKQELKNQRMKTELISNVSHDIKTPLTSIITYVDLLKQQGLDCEDAPKYLDVLDQKSIRLKKLTEDLFEAAKASSGDIPVHMETVDLCSLLKQTMGELDDRFAQKGLNVIIKTGAEKYLIRADGQLMWRVLENLFGNAIKYALENSRVYVDIYEAAEGTDGRRMAIMEMKNVSQNPLNIPAEELMERFKRGDEARTTEGSGLGLSIAKDLVTMQNGQFELMIDGDLFKAIISMEICQ